MWFVVREQISRWLPASRLGGTCRILPGCCLLLALGEAMVAFLAVLDRYCLEDLLDSKMLLRDLLGVRA